MLSSLLIAGLAIDVGRGYLLKAHLSRAVDAASLAAARSLRAGTSIAQARAVAVAAANGVRAGVNGATFSLTFGTNELDEETVSVTAAQPTPTLLMRLAGYEDMEVRSAAVAAVPPVDLVLVLDQSGSLDQANAWDDLQDAARQFVGHFDEDIDQMGLVSFNLRAESHFEITQPFYSQAIWAINSMVSVSYTNTGEGLRLAHQQFQGAGVRERSAKVVVFFTDGRPTCFRGDIGGQDRVMAAWSGNRVQGYWNDPETLPMHYQPRPDGCRGVQSCYGYGRDDVFRVATGNGAYWANQIRDAGILVYTIGLGDTSKPPGHILQPDQDYLRELANEGGITDPDQPKGRMYFAPSAGELRTVFNLVAQDLLARLTH
jgi:Flp pilus assembly protein TadG